MTLLGNQASLVRFLPEIVLGGGALAVLLVDLVRPGARRTAAVALAALAVAAASLALTAHAPAGLFGGLLQRNLPGDLATAVFLLAAAGAVLLPGEEAAAERPFFILVACLGMCLLASAADLLIAFLGIELVGISTTVLTARRRIESALHGGAASGALLYGMSLLYGAAGSTRFTDVLPVLTSGPRSLVVPAALLVAGGLGYKVLAPLVRVVSGLARR